MKFAYRCRRAALHTQQAKNPTHSTCIHSGYRANKFHPLRSAAHPDKIDVNFRNWSKGQKNCFFHRMQTNRCTVSSREDSSKRKFSTHYQQTGRQNSKKAAENGLREDHLTASGREDTKSVRKRVDDGPFEGNLLLNKERQSQRQTGLTVCLKRSEGRMVKAKQGIWQNRVYWCRVVPDFKNFTQLIKNNCTYTDMSATLLTTNSTSATSDFQSRKR